MPLPKTLFTVRGLIVAVAIVAALLPLPWRAAEMASIAVVWCGLPICLATACARMGGRVGAGVGSAIMAVAMTYVLFRWPPWSLAVPRAFWIGLTPFNLAGPIYVAARFSQGRRPALGELFWAWSGLMWTTLLVLPEWLPTHRGPFQITDIELMVECTRLTMVLALWQTFYRSGAARDAPTWETYLGWAVVECDILAWGWIATSYLWPVTSSVRFSI